MISLDEYLRGLGLTVRDLAAGASQTADVVATPVAGLLNLPLMAAGGQPVFQAKPTETAIQYLADKVGLPSPRNTSESNWGIPAQIAGGLMVPASIPESVAMKAFGAAQDGGNAIQGLLQRIQRVTQGSEGAQVVDAATGQVFKAPTTMAIEGSRLLPKVQRSFKGTYPSESLPAIQSEFASGKNLYRVQFVPKSEGSVDVGFAKYLGDGKYEAGMHSSEKPSEVMANVLESIQSYVKKHNPPEVTFQAAVGDKSRTRVYTSMAKRYAPDNYDMEVIYKPKSLYNTFKFTRKEK
jgi:hypothetical protein